jgi:hypothetical protein
METPGHIPNPEVKQTAGCRVKEKDEVKYMASSFFKLSFVFK